jgi:hypothetical protein
MAELVEPFERELQRRLLQDRESEYRRRTTRPKEYLPLSEEDVASGIIMREAPEPPPSARFESPFAEPENPEAVRQELFGSLLNPRAGIQRQPAPRTYKVKNESGGDSVHMFDPLTGEGREILSVPGTRRTPNPDVDEDIKSALALRDKAQENFDLAREAKKLEAAAALKAAEDRLKGLRAARGASAAQSVAPPEAKRPAAKSYFGPKMDDPFAPPPEAPPIANRKKGMAYQTPKGVLKWTGTGWVQP